jgi:hypothetical protein
MKSINGGLTWTDPGLDTTGKASTGSSVPVFNPATNLYEYLVTLYYRLNNVDTTIMYRLTVASASSSLTDPNCSYTTSSPKIIRTANCNVTLPTQLFVKGDLEDGNLARIQWTSQDETGSIVYIVERSDDAGAHYRSLATVSGTASPGMGNSYIFNDDVPVNGQSFYRIQLSDHQYHNYSRTILLSSEGIALGISGLVNPFVNSISFNITVPEDHDIQLSLYDAYGRKLVSSQQTAYKGINHIDLNEPHGLQTGMYILQILFRDQMITRQLIKKIE